MTDPEPYGDDYDLNVALERVKDVGVDIVVYAQNAANADGEDKEQWIRALAREVERAQARMENVEEENE